MYEYNTEMGYVKETREQRKKHVMQMSNKEKKYLVTQIKKVKDNISYGKHILEKNIVFNKKTLKETLNSDYLRNYIVEYNETPLKYYTDKRVLIRSEIKDKVYINGLGYKYCNLCFVISIITGKVVTAYYNEASDNHSTLDLDRYDKSLKII